MKAVPIACGAGRTARSCAHDLAIRNSNGRTALFNPVLIPSNRHKNVERPVMDRCAVFATDLPVSGAADEIIGGIQSDYWRMGGIETRYELPEQVHAKTTGRRQGIRLLAFFVSIFVYNMWAIERNKRGLWCRKRDLTLWIVACELARAAKRQLLVYESPARRRAASPLRLAQFCVLYCRPKIISPQTLLARYV